MYCSNNMSYWFCNFFLILEDSSCLFVNCIFFSYNSAFFSRSSRMTTFNDSTILVCSVCSASSVPSVCVPSVCVFSSVCVPSVCVFSSGCVPSVCICVPSVPSVCVRSENIFNKFILSISLNPVAIGMLCIISLMFTPCESDSRSIGWINLHKLPFLLI